MATLLVLSVFHIPALLAQTPYNYEEDCNSNDPHYGFKMFVKFKVAIDDRLDSFSDVKISKIDDEYFDFYLWHFSAIAEGKSFNFTCESSVSVRSWRDPIFGEMLEKGANVVMSLKYCYSEQVEVGEADRLLKDMLFFKGKKMRKLRGIGRHNEGLKKFRR